MPPGREEFRQNPLTGEWVICAPGRGKRPDDFEEEAGFEEEIPAYDPNCPFCPGHRDRLPDVLAELQDPGGTWRTRAVPNKFPILTSSSEVKHEQEPLFRRQPARGAHEVLIESRLHNRSLQAQKLKEVEDVLKTYRGRYQHHRQNPELQAVVIFKNHGPGAGTSLQHPHSQLMAVNTVPNFIQRRQRIAETSFQKHQRCLTCRMIEGEIKAGERVIENGADFLTIIPFAAGVPLELWILPHHHRAHFGDLKDSDIRSLARMLRDQLRRLNRLAENPDYNFVVHSSSLQTDRSRARHWLLQIVPRTTSRAGFEIGTGMAVNPSLPERTARALRDTSPD